MKLKLQLLTLALVLSFAAFSQAKVELGLKGGLNLANVNTESAASNFESATGYHVGAYALIKAASIGVQPELLYSTKGTDLKFGGSTFEQDYNYVEIPVMLKMYLLAGLNLQVGPQFGLLLSVDGKTADGSSISKDSFKGSDLSGAFGIGWDAPFGLNFTARYILGLTDVSDGGPEAKNRTFQASLGYRLFKVGK